jgi:hypothetical protein
MTNEDSPIRQPSSPDSSPGGNTPAAGSNENSGIPWPLAGDPFWSETPEAQVKWYLDQQDQQAEQLFSKEFDRHMEAVNRQYTEPFPEWLETKIAEHSRSLVWNNAQALQALRQGDGRAVKHAIEETLKRAQTLTADYREHQRDPLGRINRSLWNSNIDDERALKPVRALQSPRIGEVYPDRQKFFDEDLPAIFGRK